MRNHREALCTEFLQFDHKIHLLSKLSNQTFDIDDPVGGDEVDYRLCADEMGQIIKTGFQLFSELINQTFNIDDPVGGDVEDYRVCADEMGQIIEKGCQHLKAWTK